MTWFIAVAVALTLATLFVVLFPLLRKRKSEDEGNSSELSITVLRDHLSELEKEHQAGLLDAGMFSQEQADLERRALEDGAVATPVATQGASKKVKLAAFIGVAIPAMAAGLYLYLGTPDALRPQAATDAAGNHSVTPEQIQAMVARLAERLQSNPNDGEGWLMLGRSYSALGRYPESAAAFGRATEILPPSANLLADYADILAMAQGRRLAGEPEKVIARALSVDPRHVKSLALSGSAAFERGDFEKAIREWRTILSVVPADSNVAASVQQSIADAESKLGRPVVALGRVASASEARAGQGATTNAEASVSGSVVVAPALMGKLPANATLYVFARNTDGSRIPLAMSRVAGAKFPHTFTLNDSMSMAPNVKLSDAKSVVIGARISLSGDALPKPGDFEGLSAQVKLGTSGVVVTIDTVKQ